MAGVHPRPGDDIGVTAQGGSASDRSRTGAGSGRRTGAAGRCGRGMAQTWRAGGYSYRGGGTRPGARRGTRMAHAERRRGLARGEGRRAVRSQLGRGGLTGRSVRPEQVRYRDGRASVARVPPPVRRLDADRPARGRRGEPGAEGVGDRHRSGRADAVQCGARPAAGGEGGRFRRRAAEDDDHQGQGQGDARWTTAGDPRRATRSR